MNKNEAFGLLCDYINDLHTRKSYDYGDSFGQMWQRFGVTSAVIRLTDKMNRVYSLTSGKTAKVKDESLRDTLLDLASYALMTVVEMDNDQSYKPLSTHVLLDLAEVPSTEEDDRK